MLIDLGRTYTDRNRKTLKKIFRKICREFNLPLAAPEGFALVASLTDRNCSIEYQKINGGNYVPYRQRPLLDITVDLIRDKCGQPTGEFSFALRSKPNSFCLEDLTRTEVK